MTISERYRMTQGGPGRTAHASHANGRGYGSAARLAWLLALPCCAMSALWGCSSEEQAKAPPASQPAAETVAQPPPRPAEPASAPSPLLSEAETWSLEEAVAGLADDGTRLSAAVRLVRLSGVAPLCVPDPLPAKIAERLRVAQLSEDRWALGLSMPGDCNCLASPVLIDATGDVTLPVEGVEEEVASLCPSEDTELFPHLLFVPGRVWIVEKELQSALVARSPEGLRFELRREDDVPYVALLWRSPPRAAEGSGEESAPAGDLAELARYRYDPYELAFLGPLSDKLPQPPGAVFELDLEQSEALVPVGGVIPKPPPVTPVTPPGEDEATPY